MKYEIEARGAHLINIRMDGRKASQWVSRVIDAKNDIAAKIKATRWFSESADVIKVYRIIDCGGAIGASVNIGTKRRRIKADGKRWGITFDAWKLEDHEEALAKDLALEDQIRQLKKSFN